MYLTECLNYDKSFIQMKMWPPIGKLTVKYFPSLSFTLAINLLINLIFLG